MATGIWLICGFTLACALAIIVGGALMDGRDDDGSIGP